MHGIGDNLHQRAIMRVLKRTHNITLETSWASLYWDLIDDDFRVVGRSVALRTQQKNAERERHLFSPNPPPHHIQSQQRIRYVTSTIAQTKSGTITEAMMQSIGVGQHFHEADFRLPLKDEWLAEADRIMASWPTGGKPIMIYRPLLERPEWRGGSNRNANVAQYEQLTRMLHEKYFVVSVADLEASKEWIVGPEYPADLKFHKGEFVFEILASIFHRADLIFTSGGFAAILGPAVETPTISVLGGYEPAGWCGDGAKFSPYLAIDPINPCKCGSSGCMNRCVKTLDMPKARAAISDFTSMAVSAVVETAPKPETREPHMRLELPTVTLLCVETQMHELARLAILDSMAKVKFGEVVIHTDRPDLIVVPGALYVSVPNWPEKIQCGTYCYNDAPKSVNTPHMIFLEWDGVVRDVNAWEPGFLDYDYIGAPWPGKRAGQWTPREGCSVGNGGFTLWSKKLMDCLSANRSTLRVATDTHISIEHRRALESLCGAKWAPEDVGFRFSYEHGTEEERARPSFGVHDVFNWPLALDQAAIIHRAKILMANDYVVRTSKLYTMAQRAPYLRTIPGFEDRMMLHRQHAREARRTAATRPVQRPTPQRAAIFHPHRTQQPFPPVVTTPTTKTTAEAYHRELQRRGLKA